MFIRPQRCWHAVGDESPQLAIAAPQHARERGIAVPAAIDDCGERRAGIWVALVNLAGGAGLWFATPWRERSRSSRLCLCPFCEIPAIIDDCMHVPGYRHR